MNHFFLDRTKDKKEEQLEHTMDSVKGKNVTLDSTKVKWLKKFLNPTFTETFFLLTHTGQWVFHLGSPRSQCDTIKRSLT